MTILTVVVTSVPSVCFRKNAFDLSEATRRERQLSSRSACLVISSLFFSSQIVRDSSTQASVNGADDYDNGIKYFWRLRKYSNTLTVRAPVEGIRCDGNDKDLRH